jgi:hypothetical protein
MLKIIENYEGSYVRTKIGENISKKNLIHQNSVSMDPYRLLRKNSRFLLNLQLLAA